MLTLGFSLTIHCSFVEGVKTFDIIALMLIIFNFNCFFCTILRYFWHDFDFGMIFDMIFIWFLKWKAKLGEIWRQEQEEELEAVAQKKGELEPVKDGELDQM